MNATVDNMPLERAPSKLLKLLAKEKTGSATAADIEVLMQTPADQLDAPSRMWLKFAKATLEQIGNIAPTRPEAMPFQTENDRPEGVTAQTLLDEVKKLAGAVVVRNEKSSTQASPTAAPKRAAMGNAPPCEGNVAWKKQFSARGGSDPFIDDQGFVYFTYSDYKGGILCCLNSTDGEIKWTKNNDESFLSAPFASNNEKIYVGGTSGNLLAYERDGSVAIASSPAKGVKTIRGAVIEDEKGNMYFGRSDGVLYALFRDGKERWVFQSGAAIFHSPTKGPLGTVYVGSDKLYAVDTVDGTEKWKFEVEGRTVTSGSATGEKGTIYVGMGRREYLDNAIFAINPEDGTEKWRVETENTVQSTPVVANGMVYVGCDDGHVYALREEDGEVVWEFESPDGLGFASSPSVGSDGTIYIGCEDGMLYAINPDDGEKKWEFGTGGPIGSSPLIGTNGWVYFCSDDGYFYALK